MCGVRVTPEPLVSWVNAEGVLRHAVWGPHGLGQWHLHFWVLPRLSQASRCVLGLGVTRTGSGASVLGTHPSPLVCGTEAESRVRKPLCVDCAA